MTGCSLLLAHSYHDCISPTTPHPGCPFTPTSIAFPAFVSCSVRIVQRNRTSVLGRSSLQLSPKIYIFSARAQSSSFTVTDREVQAAIFDSFMAKRTPTRRGGNGRSNQHENMMPAASPQPQYKAYQTLTPTPPPATFWGQPLAQHQDAGPWQRQGNPVYSTAAVPSETIRILSRGGAALALQGPWFVENPHDLYPPEFETAVHASSQRHATLALFQQIETGSFTWGLTQRTYTPRDVLDLIERWKVKYPSCMTDRYKETGEWRELRCQNSSPALH